METNMTRTENIKKYILDYTPEICTERGLIYTEEFFNHPQKPVVIRRAEAFRRTLNEMSIYIGDHDLLVGNSSSKPRAASLFPEYAVNWMMDELDTFSERPQQRFKVSDENREKIKSVCRAWDGYTHYDLVGYHLNDNLNQVLNSGSGEAAYEHPSINDVMFIEHNQNGDGHIIPDYISLLNTGLDPVIKKAEVLLEKLAFTDEEYLNKKAFLDSVVISLKGVIEYANRLADLAHEMARIETNTDRKEELLNISETCRKIPAKKPDSFFEALQFVLLLHTAIQIESNGHSISLGRMDSYLYPYYREDFKKGLLTNRSVQQLYECFLLKCFEANKLRDWSTTEILGGNQLFQTITLGGQNPDGKTSVNELSYIFLEALGNTNMNIPTVVVSAGESTPMEFYEAGLNALLKHGGGMPAFFNDDIAVEMMLRDGVELVDARNWAGMGCSEVRVPGKHGTGVTPVYLNLLKILELALHNGTNPSDGTVLKKSSRDIRSASNIEDIIAAFTEQLDFYLPFIPKIEHIIGASYYTLTPTPYLSSIMNYRLDIAKDISWGRGPNYNNTIVHVHGIPNIANSLTAIDELVFKEKKYTLKEIIEAMDNNYSQADSKKIQKAVLECPKVGNDDDTVDAFFQRIFKLLPDKMKQFKPHRGGLFGCTAQTVVMNVSDGAVIGATPDGRISGESIADNLSPTAGTDFNGVSAVFNSVAKVDHALMDNGSILNIRFHPSALSTDEKIRKIAQAIYVYFSKGGFQVQFNVIGKDTLMDAQDNPEKYSSLVVKVAGFSSFYVDLEKKWQDHLIARTEYH
jgi:pyruvate formate-lyase/glycerol dehydratase family glycyl radical enzyme